MTLLARPVLPKHSKAKRTCIYPTSKLNLKFKLKYAAHPNKPRLLPASYLLIGATCHFLTFRCPPAPAPTDFPCCALGGAIGPQADTVRYRRVWHHQPARGDQVLAGNPDHERHVPEGGRELEVDPVPARPHAEAVRQDADPRRRQDAVLRRAHPGLSLGDVCLASPSAVRGDGRLRDSHHAPHKTSLEHRMSTVARAQLALVTHQGP